MTNKPTLKLISDLKELLKNFIYNLDENLTIIISQRESALKNCKATIKLLDGKTYEDEILKCST